MEYKKSLLKNIRNFLSKRIDKVIAQQNLLTGMPLFFNLKKELGLPKNTSEKNALMFMYGMVTAFSQCRQFMEQEYINLTSKK